MTLFLRQKTPVLVAGTRRTFCSSLYRAYASGTIRSSTIDKAERKVAAEETLYFVVEERKREENTLEYCVDLDDNSCGALGLLGDKTGYYSRNEEYQERLAYPHEVDAYGVEYEPVRFRYEREAIGIVAEQQKNAQQDVRAPCGERYQDQLVYRAIYRP